MKFVAAVLLAFFGLSLTQRPTVQVEDAKFWTHFGNEQLKYSLALEHIMNEAKNIIIFIGDGMGMSTITAARIYKEQKDGHSGEEGYLNFEKFPSVGLVKTYTVDKQVPDSAGTATAIFTGVKANYYMLGFDATAKFNVCDTTLNEQSKVSSMMNWAQDAGKHTGFVTTTRLTHATPAALYAHSNNREWECDSKIPKDHLKCKDIARQLVEDAPGKNFRVILAGGQKQMGVRVQNNTDTSCTRNDSRNLLETWIQDKRKRHSTYQYVNSTDDLLSVDIKRTDYLLGLFSPGHMSYEVDRDTSPSGQPSIMQMTEQAIKMLQKNENGFVLMVEGGRIDHAHHDNMAQIALEETVQFDEAIEKALSLTNIQDTLIIVTADHSHTLTINGYPNRGDSILGYGGVTNQSIPYETLTYANGPGYSEHRLYDSTNPNTTWRNLSSVARSDPHYRHFAPVPLSDETHGGEDVPVYAIGPYSHLFHGVHEQNHINYVVRYAACIGSSVNHCTESYKSPKMSKGSIIKVEISVLLAFFYVQIYLT